MFNIYKPCTYARTPKPSHANIQLRGEEFEVSATSAYVTDSREMVMQSENCYFTMKNLLLNVANITLNVLRP